LHILDSIQRVREYMVRMSDEWFVRVHDKEYGPVDLDELLEWKAEGRLIAENPVRRAGDTDWTTAATIPQLFPPPLPEAGGDARDPVRRRTFGDILAETFRIYAKGFPQFVALALMVAIPSLALKLSLAFVKVPEGEPLAGTARNAAAVAIVMLIALVAVWPIFLAGIQLATADLAAGRVIRLGDILRRATNLWPRSCAWRCSSTARSCSGLRSRLSPCSRSRRALR
jgi:hypothetical protein